MSTPLSPSAAASPDDEPLSADQALTSEWLLLAAKLQSHINGSRFDNIVDLLSILSDLVDFADPALIDKLSKTFEEIVAASTAAGGALRIASAEAKLKTDAPSLRALWSSARHPDTRRGIDIVLRMLEIIGRLHAVTPTR
ncbi:hypothetical protein WS67_19665 [Burkholderia singularis]|uniref:DUF1641 domain-containing protein n=1 Tax=Burkholderia singularis TaxID=1503053 RepID=A0A103DYN7_9BURK|nr:hypothetical protein [Burkholderia singularis]KVE25112.1 hypothetical protein WS67_19665 [Burkholderia singularis]SMF99636.1 FIG00457144: hypothetical protein [Burkholderia singularis]